MIPNTTRGGFGGTALLVPLDGSRLAEQALPVAGAIARRAGAAVHLVTVQSALPVLAHPYEVPSVVEMETAVRDRLREYLAAMAEALSTTHGLNVVYTVLDGSPPSQLAEYARAKDIGLVVMTTHGRGGISRYWLGSVADQLLRRVTVPVLLLRSRDDPQPLEFRQLLVALDGSPESEGVVEPAVALGQLASGARFTLVKVVEPPLPAPIPPPGAPMYPVYPGPDVTQALQESAARYLDGVAERLRARDFVVTAQAVVDVNVSRRIVDLARAEGCDLIALGTHGARGIERLVLGSVADKVIRAATVPVLVVPVRLARAPEPEAAERPHATASSS